MRISDWSSDVCSSDLNAEARPRRDDDPLSDIHWGHLSRSSNFAPSADFKNFVQHGIGFEPPKLRENPAFCAKFPVDKRPPSLARTLPLNSQITCCPFPSSPTICKGLTETP